jgi:L-arabinose isomerase
MRYGQEGREVQFTLRPGDAVIARVGLYRGELRLLAVAVEVTPEPVALRRAGALVRTTATPAGEVVRAMLEGGWEHHVALVHGSVMEQLRTFARLAGIPLLAL